MGNQFHPDFYIQNMSSIDPARLKARGIRLVVIDMDNTLIPSCEMVVPAQAHRFIDALRKEGIMPVVVSNNVSRITRSRCEQLQIACYPFSLKPLPRGFRKVLRRYHCRPQETAVIGDQILTDIFGGNQMGMLTILVDPLSEKDHIFGRMNRMMAGILQHLDHHIPQRGEYYGKL
ncbi:MAG: YqeG family HAD IIIA-type phosphatase [Erysipelotrichaceae bacterium]|nr:YqeG family HAD IIIA-type phosphatase [Erysipelotrichaceae bacterium]